MFSSGFEIISDRVQVKKDVGVVEMNDENLVSFKDMTPSRQREIASAGGKACQRKKKEKKLLKETINEFLQAINPESGQTFQIDLVNAMIQQALTGDVSAFNTVRDTAGQKPKEDVQAVVMPVINIKGL